MRHVVVAEYQLVRFVEVSVPDGAGASLADVIGRSGIHFDALRHMVVSVEETQASAASRGLRERMAVAGTHFAVVPSPVGLEENHGAVEARAGAA